MMRFKDWLATMYWRFHNTWSGLERAEDELYDRIKRVEAQMKEIERRRWHG